LNPDFNITTILFDFGGVIAEEGFREGLRAIARKNGLQEAAFIDAAYEIIHASGYLVGKASEHDYWSQVRAQTGIGDDDETLRNECLSRFIIRDWMLALTRTLREHGRRLAILSDQTDWLDLLNQRYDFFRYFDDVFNSFHMGKGKRNPEHFDDVIRTLGIPAREALFIDDDAGNCERARQRGLQAIQYTERSDFMNRMRRYCPFLPPDGPEMT